MWSQQGTMRSFSIQYYSCIFQYSSQDIITDCERKIDIHMNTIIADTYHFTPILQEKRNECVQNLYINISYESK